MNTTAETFQSNLTCFMYLYFTQMGRNHPTIVHPDYETSKVTMQKHCECITYVYLQTTLTAEIKQILLQFFLHQSSVHLNITKYIQNLLYLNLHVQHNVQNLR